MFDEQHHDAGTVVPASNMTPPVLPAGVQRLVTASLSEASKKGVSSGHRPLRGDWQEPPCQPAAGCGVFVGMRRDLRRGDVAAAAGVDQ